jgi:hypothetical protein
LRYPLALGRQIDYVPLMQTGNQQQETAMKTKQQAKQEVRKIMKRKAYRGMQSQFTAHGCDRYSVQIFDGSKLVDDINL